MSLTTIEKGRITNRIVSGYAVFILDGEMYYIHDPNLNYEYEGSLYEQEKLNELLEKGVLCEEACLAVLAERNLWNSDNLLKIKEFEGAIKELKSQLRGLEFKSISRQNILLQIKYYKKQIKQIEDIKESLITNSAEYLARLEKYKWFLFNLTYDKNKNRKWEDWGEFSKLSEKFMFKLVTNAYFNPDLNDVNIREIAHNEPWRSLWVYMSKTGQAFDIKNITLLQKSLISWSLVYDNVYESMDCPSEEVINDNDLLDLWFEKQHEKNKKDKEAKSADILAHSNHAIKNAQEVGVVVESLEDARKIYNMNTGLSKAQIRARMDLVSQKGEVSERYLPDVKQNITMQINQMAMNRGKR